MKKTKRPECYEIVAEFKEPELLTEEQFIEKYKKKGFELYKTESLKPKLDAYEAALLHEK